MPRPTKKEIKKCDKCGKLAVVRYKNEWYCGPCLNPEPTLEYLQMERERANGQWGHVPYDMWHKV
ncbi:MAG: hypothetical protein JXX29_00935 [Deltaproteobacteria bacterium]|nr:hypothetical protein [Deltaproteobacteria bacterium]MBN2670203.1 hypothetical protein [Deltaproteobacteria bacterium]